jgi:predicted AAA+ superfamily ATPase
MSAVIHELWMNNDESLMIMPGSIPLDAPNVRDELTRHLPDAWNAIVDHEVDGKNSIPFQKDQSNPRYGSRMAARRVARSVMLGSAPTDRSQNVRGIEASHVRLGIIQPGENIADFNDALNTLTQSLAYLYTSGTRYWFDVRPTLRKTASDRAAQMSDSDVKYEIERRLRRLRKEPPAAGIHICPASTLDVPDEQNARLVILRPADEYETAAMTACEDILNNRGSSPRTFRNTLAFIAADRNSTANLKQAVSFYLAWDSIKNESEALNLDAVQNRETENNLRRADETVNTQIKETYCWLIFPHIDKDADMKTILWERDRINGGSEGIIQKAIKKLLQNEALIERWAPLLLKTELDNLLWRESDHISIKQLWEYLCTYCYLPRLANESVLINTIRNGAASPEYFAIAAGFDGKRYIDLKFNRQIESIEKSSLLVKPAAAKKQLAEEAAVRGENLPTGKEDAYAPPAESGNGLQENAPPAATPKIRRFYMSADLDATRINRDVQNYVEEIIQHLTASSGANVHVSLEVEAKSTEGFNQQTVRTVTENCRTLKVRDAGFEE